MKPFAPLLSLGLALSLATPFFGQVARASDPSSCPAPSEQFSYNPFFALNFSSNPYFFENILGYKSPASVDRYLACWNTPERHRLYLTRYKAMIQRASQSTGVPFAILACLFFVESRFEKDVQSPTGALGLTQFLSGTWKGQIYKLRPAAASAGNIYMAANIRDLTPKGSRLDAKANEFTRVFAQVLKNGKISGASNLNRIEKLLTPFLQSENEKLRTIVSEYLSNIHAAQDALTYQKVFAEYFTRVGKKPPNVESENLEDPSHRSDPELAIILSAMYLQMDVVRGIYGPTLRLHSPDEYVIATGGYNLGPADIKCPNKMSATECISQMEAAHGGKPTQATGQMRSVRNCSEHGNKNPMPSDEKKGERECQKTI